MEISRQEQLSLPCVGRPRKGVRSLPFKSIMLVLVRSTAVMPCLSTVLPGLATTTLAAKQQLMYSCPKPAAICLNRAGAASLDSSPMRQDNFTIASYVCILPPHAKLNVIDISADCENFRKCA